MAGDGGQGWETRSRSTIRQPHAQRPARPVWGGVAAGGRDGGSPYSSSTGVSSASGDHRRSQAPLRTPIVISSSDSSDSSSDRSTSSATSTAGPAAIVVGRCIALLGVCSCAQAVAGILRIGFITNFLQRRQHTLTNEVRLCSHGLCGVPARNSARAPTLLCRHRVPQLTHTNHAHATPLPPPRYTTQHACTYLTLPLQRLRLPAAPRRRAGQDGGGQQGGPRRPRRRPWPRQGDEGI